MSACFLKLCVLSIFGATQASPSLLFCLAIFRLGRLLSHVFQAPETFVSLLLPVLTFFFLSAYVMPTYPSWLSTQHIKRSSRTRRNSLLAVPITRRNLTPFRSNRRLAAWRLKKRSERSLRGKTVPLESWSRTLETPRSFSEYLPFFSECP